MYLEYHELATVCGGGLSATMLNAISRVVSLVYNIGYSVGSTLRRVTNHKVCKL